MIRLVFFIITFLLAVTLIARYLGPDDLTDCGQSPSSEAACQTSDVIVAVSGGDTVARTMEAIKLYKNGWAPRVVFSGAAEDENSPSNAAVMHGIAVASGVPDSAILIDEKGRTTKQNAEETADLLRAENMSSMILVTSAYHQRRASLEFGQRFDTVTIRNHPVEQDSQWSFWWWITPVGWYLAIGEVVRIIFFYVGATR